MAFFDFFKRGLKKSTVKISRAFAAILGGVKLKSAEDFDELEAILVASDFGISAAGKLTAMLKERYELGQLSAEDDLKKALRDEVVVMLKKNRRDINIAPAGTPTVILMAGVNGSGKTTTIGKLADKFAKENKKVILAACDTFRAAAIEQLQLWGERTGATVIASRHGADPASVAFDAANAAISRNADYLIIDTAGRQQNNAGLMAELTKIRRTVAKVLPDAPHEVWMTVDSTFGANVLSQAREFSAACGVTGLVLTKVDGTGRGGMIVALNEEFSLPTFYIGLGESPEDLQDFDPEMYADALFRPDGE